MLFSAAATNQPIQFGPYLLTECVGQGGMAVVYKATRHGPSGFEKTVVVKAMLPTLSSQKEFVAMFSAEARLMAQLTHPNIVQVHDFGVVDGIPYLAMEYLPGRNLSQLRAALATRGQTLPVGASLAIAREMCLGLGYAHDFVDSDGKRRQIIHRDVSPSNVMVCRDGSVKLLDFGVAKILDEFDYDVTQSFKGKYAYMAPEQVNHLPIDRRVDVFAAGVVLHELLTGKRLFAAPTELETLQRVSAAQVVAPSVDNPEVPRALDAIVKKALAREPVWRYGSGQELAEALETLDALAWPRKRLAALVAELFADEWQVVCEICGKSVLRGSECAECGTAAPEISAPKEVEPADEARAISARQAIAPILATQNTDRNEIDEPLAQDPLPLPPAPAPRPARPRLAVVHTPLPPAPRLPGVALPPDEPSSVVVAPEPLVPPKLFVVPRPTSQVTPAVTPLPAPSPLLQPRPASPQPLFVVPPTPAPLAVPELRQSRATVVLALLGAAALLVIALVLALQKTSATREAIAPVTTPAPSVAPAPVVHEAAAPVAPAPKPAEPAHADAPAEESVEALLRDENKAPIIHEMTRPRARRHRAPHAAAPSTPGEPERTVKDGRIVDPFAGMN